MSRSGGAAFGIAVAVALVGAACSGGGGGALYPGAPAPDAAHAAAAPLHDGGAAPSSAGGKPTPATGGARDRLLVLDLRGSLPERAPALDLSDAPTLRRILDRLAAARKDPRTRTVLVRIGALSVGSAIAGELREALVATTAAGKRVVCHSDGGGDAELMVASACAEATVSPGAELFVVGAHLEMVFVKPLLDRLGVVADFEHVGRWKGAAEPLLRDSPSPELRESYQAIVDAADRALVAAVAAGRHLRDEEVTAALDRAPLTADDAVAAHLFDKVGYSDELLARESASLEVVEAFPRGKPKEDLGSLFELFSSKGKGHTARAHIALVPVVGTIVDGSDDGSPWSDEARASELVRALDEARASDAVKAVVLRISSPGGSALASDLIWRAVRRVREKKPVVASMGEVAASGGYYVASAAQTIFASPSTLTGSIGVVGGKLVLGGLLEKVGVKTARFGARAHAHAMSTTTRFSPGERLAVVHAMERTYDLFLDRVATGRSLAREKVAASAEGRVWVGTEARARGLIDTLGGLEAALAAARKLGGLDGDAPVESYPAAKSLLDLLSRRMEAQVRGDFAPAVVSLLGAVAPGAAALVASLPSLSREAVWTLWPVAFTLR